MRLVVDTNVLVNALLSGSSLPGHLLAWWREGRFDLVTGLSQLDEVARVLRYPHIRVHLAAGVAGRLMNDLRNKPCWFRAPYGSICHRTRTTMRSWGSRLLAAPMFS